MSDVVNKHTKKVLEEQEQAAKQEGAPAGSRLSERMAENFWVSYIDQHKATHLTTIYYSNVMSLDVINGDELHITCVDRRIVVYGEVAAELGWRIAHKNLDGIDATNEPMITGIDIRDMMGQSIFTYVPEKTLPRNH